MAMPRWTWRRALGELVCALVVAYLLRGHGTPHVYLGFWGALFGVLTGIWDAFKTGVELAGTAILAGLKWLKSRVFDLGRVLGSGLAFIGGGLKDFAGGVADFISNGVIPAFQTFYGWIKSGVDLFQKGVDKIIGWVQTIRGWITDIYDKFIKPITDAIDYTRRALDILASLGVDSAAALSKKLGLVEQKIQQPFLDIISKLNEVIGVLDRVMTFNGLFQKLTLFASLFSYKKDFKNFTINQMFEAKPRVPGEPAPPEPTSEEILQQNIDELTAIATGKAEVTPAVQEWADDLLQKVKRAA